MDQLLRSGVAYIVRIIWETQNSLIFKNKVIHLEKYINIIEHQIRLQNSLNKGTIDNTISNLNFFKNLDIPCHPKTLVIRVHIFLEDFQEISTNRMSPTFLICVYGSIVSILRIIHIGLNQRTRFGHISYPIGLSGQMGGSLVHERVWQQQDLVPFDWK